MEQQFDNQKLQGKVALITGGGSGIGKASAILMAKHGAKVVIIERNGDRLQKVQKEIEAFGGTALSVVADISKPETVEACFKQTMEKFGQLDIVFANAGINGVLAPIEQMEDDDFSTTVDTNLKGTFYTVKYAVPHMKERGGSIMITSSINGNRVFSNIGFSAYSSTKAAQVAFMKMAALELARYKIRVNAICPGAIDTNIDENTESTPELDTVRIPVEFPQGDQPLAKKSGSAKQVADLALFLASQDSSHITGTDIYIDGAESLIRG